tara:strand:+ start:13521 stop:13754 length:234 start_codon:yes stop_codon:yes gene_type:complete
MKFKHKVWITLKTKTMKTNYTRSTAIEMIKQVHIKNMKRALNLRKDYKNLDTAEIIENEFYINNNVNSYTEHLITNN